jgi:hypothetical protein
LFHLGLSGITRLGKFGTWDLHEIQGVSPLANREQFFLIEGFLFIGCHAINLEPKTELHLAAGDLLRVVNHHAATGYKSVSSHIGCFVSNVFHPAI